MWMNCFCKDWDQIIFYTGVRLINNVVLVSCIQRSDSVIHTHVLNIYSFSDSVPIEVITKYWAEFSVLYSRSFERESEAGDVCVTTQTQAALLGGFCMAILRCAFCERSYWWSKLRACCHVGHSGVSQEPRFIYKPTGKAPEPSTTSPGTTGRED